MSESIYSMTVEDNDTINWIKNKSRFINSDMSRLVNIHKKLIGKSVDWKCPTCVRGAIDELKEYQKKNNL